jgi:nucleotide-binding universal stress UspA family protein
MGGAAVDSTSTGRVVVGVRGGPAGLQAIRYAVAEARRRAQPLIAVRAFSCSGNLALFAAAAEEAAGQEITLALAGALGRMPDDVKVRPFIREGPPGTVLTAVAGRPADLLVIGGSGPHRWIGGRRGHVARECARHAACPVVIVPPPAMARTGSESKLAHDAALGVEAFLRLSARVDLGRRPSEPPARHDI